MSKPDVQFRALEGTTLAMIRPVDSNDPSLVSEHKPLDN